MNLQYQRKLPWEMLPTILALAWPTMLERLLDSVLEGSLPNEKNKLLEAAKQYQEEQV